MTKQFKQKYKLLGLLLMLCLVGCDTQQAEAPSPYPVLDSGMTASTKSGDNIYWMDNDRVIFVSYGPKPKTVEEQRQRKPSIYIWDTRSNNIKKYADGRQLCYHEGYIRYAGPDRLPVPSTKYFIPPLYEGSMGKEVITNSHVFDKGLNKNRSGSKFQLNRYTCKHVERPASMGRKTWIPLLEKHGALMELDTIPDIAEREQPVVYHRASDDKLIALNIKRGDIGSINPRYYMAYRDAYFFYEPAASGSKIQQTNCIRYWWLSFDEKTEEGCQTVIPFNNLGMGVLLFPTKAGVLVYAGKISDYSAGTAGFYLVNENQEKKVIKGWVHAPALSNDGCKIAYAHTPFLFAQHVGSPGETRLKITNLCANGGNENE